MVSAFKKIKELDKFIIYLTSSKIKEFQTKLEKFINDSGLFNEPTANVYQDKNGKLVAGWDFGSKTKTDHWYGYLDFNNNPKISRLNKVSIIYDFEGTFLHTCGKLGCILVIRYTPTKPSKTYEKKTFFSTKKIDIYKSKKIQFRIVPADIESFEEKDRKKIDKGFSNLIEQLSTPNSYQLNNSMTKFIFKLDKFLNAIIDQYYSEFLVFKNETNSKLSEFDKDGNGLLDTIEVKDDFDKIVKKHQSKIIETDKSYIQQFVKISNYQKQKRKNLQSIFESINKIKNEEDLSNQVSLLKKQIHSYELILFHSLNMVTCLVEEDMFTFYEIYESFDKLEVFNSNHENEVTERLKNIEGGINDLMNSIRKMDNKIIGALDNLSYFTQESYSKFSHIVSKELKSIDSSISINNLLTGINAYQTYKLRKGK